LAAYDSRNPSSSAAIPKSVKIPEPNIHGRDGTAPIAEVITNPVKFMKD
jgi:hypothetical protein